MVQTPSVPPVEKLPLAARKNIRDEFESKIADLTKTVSDLLKQPYKLEVNFNQFYAYGAATEDQSSWVKNSPGNAATQYFESFIYYLKQFTDEGKYDDAIEAFNDLVTEKRISIEAGGPDIVYSDCSIKDGTFEINYDPKKPGTNVDYACRELPKRFDEALFARSPDTLPMIAKRSIRDDWEKERDSVLKQARDELLGAEIKFVVDYEAIWKTIVAGKKVNAEVDPQDKARSFGSTVKGYFEGFVWQLKDKIKKDDMMVEGFMEAVSTSQIALHVAPEGTELKETYSDLEIVDGVFILKTSPRYFGTNVDYVARKMANIKKAQRRIFLSSLYIGHDEHELLQALHTALQTKPELQVTLQLDYFRSTRPGAENTALALLPLIRAFPDRVHVNLYRSPTLKGLMASAVPRRFDEGWGTWHAKLYGVDDDLILSGANLNKSYFENRQDRYIVFRQLPRLADYCADFLRIFSQYSYQVKASHEGDSYDLRWASKHCPEASFVSSISQELDTFQHENRVLMSSSPSEPNLDIELLPMIQSGPLSIREEEIALSTLFYGVVHSPESLVDLTSGYFALYSPYQHQVFNSLCRWRILAASPQANGFYGSNGISGRIPDGYTILEERFWRGVKRAGKQHLVDLREWGHQGWTYHAKGLWIRPSPDQDPTTTVFGSTNLNSRSANLDTELSFILHTSSPELCKKLGDEVDNVWKYSESVNDDTWAEPHRVPSLSTRLIVALVEKML